MTVTKDEACWIVRASGWLAGESRDFQDALLWRCHLRQFGEKETLFHEGDPCAGLFALVSGVLRIEFATPDRDYRIATIKQPVFWCGTSAAIRRSSYFVTAVTGSPVTTLFLPLHEFERMAEDAASCRAFARLSIEHYEEAQQVVGQLLIGDMEQRVGARLALLAEKSGGPQPPVIPITQADLAEMCGVSRITVQQVLNALEKRGFIKAGYRKITVLDAGALLGRVGAPDPARAGAIV